jgi:phosphatidylinositol 3,5-bisphosphate 5-phosphatase
VTKRSQVALVGGHYIYTVEKTEMLPLTTTAQSKAKSEKYIDENRYVSILNSLDLTKSFYFSYSYDCTRTLQYNIMREREALQEGEPEPSKKDHNDMFVWNHYLLAPARASLKNPHDWCLSIIHGYVHQVALSVYWGRVVYITLIARRSRFFAGARFLKRGANDLGHVANDVESEQIVSEMLTTSFHAPGPSLFANPNWTSYVQHRGSIPLHWMQEASTVAPKPNIHLSVVDPFFSATALHFDDLFHRYGTPVYVLNLIKQKERIPRETKLLGEYKSAVDYLNQFLPPQKKIIYRAWDMSRAQKTRDGNVVGTLDQFADDIIPRTGFFQNGNDAATGLKLQNGVARTNCIDCVDRTNAAQLMIGKKAFGYQLQALGIVESPDVEFDSDAITLFMDLWNEHGDIVAVQYGGSHLVNTMNTYLKTNAWHSQSRDIMETVKRYYNNILVDSQRQEAYNLFLGNYVFQHDHPMLWDLTSDYYLHHSDPRSMFGKARPSYRQWYTTRYLEEPSIPPTIWPQEFRERPLHFFDDFWVEYYRPLTLSSFKKLLPFKMRSNMNYIPIAQTTSGKYDLSPFKVRTDQDRDSDKPPNRPKGVKIIVPSEASSMTDTTSIDARLASPMEHPNRPNGTWFDAQPHQPGMTRKYTGIIKETSFEVSPPTPRVPKLPTTTSTSTDGTATDTNLPREMSKAELAIQAFTSLVASSIKPTVKQAEEYEYHRYITHPSNIPLVVDTAVDYTKTPAEFLDYLSRGVETPHGRPADWEYVDEERGMTGMTLEERAETSLEAYAEFVESGGREEPLTVLDEDGGKKRYKAYRQWLRGKSLFKQRLIVGGEVV